MALHTKQDFAKLADIRTNDISTYVKRRKIIVRDDGMIDDKESVNKTFLKTRQSLASKKSVIDHIKKFPAANSQTPNEENNDDEFPYFDGATKRGSDEKAPDQTAAALEKLIHFRAEKVERETIKLDIDIAKKRGEIIPSEMVKPIFLQHNQFILTKFKNASDDLIRLIAKRKELTAEEVAEIKSEMVDVINHAIAEAIQMSVSSVDDIVNEFKVKRGAGEKKV